VQGESLDHCSSQVQFQVGVSPHGGDLRAVNICSKKEFIRGTIESVKEQVRKGGVGRMVGMESGRRDKGKWGVGRNQWDRGTAMGKVQ